MEEVNNEIKKKNLNKTWLLVGGLIILTVVLLIVSFASKNLSPLKSKTENEKAFMNTSLVVSEDIRTISDGNYETDIIINTNGDKISGAQIDLAFEPMHLTNVDIKSGDFLKNPSVLLKTVDTKNGTIRYIIAIKPGENTVGGTGTIATLSFTKNNSEATNIGFLPTSQVSTTGLNQSILKETISAEIQ